MSEQDTQNTFNNEVPNSPQDTSPKDSQANESEPKEMAFGPVIGILIIVALLVFGGLYFWGSYLQKDLGMDLPLTDENSLEFFFDDTADMPADRPSFEPSETPIADDNYTELDLFVDEADAFGDLDALDAELGNLELGL